MVWHNTPRWESNPLKSEPPNAERVTELVERRYALYCHSVPAKSGFGLEVTPLTVWDRSEGVSSRPLRRFAQHLFRQSRSGSDTGILQSAGLYPVFNKLFN